MSLIEFATQHVRPLIDIVCKKKHIIHTIGVLSRQHLINNKQSVRIKYEQLIIDTICYNI